MEGSEALSSANKWCAAPSNAFSWNFIKERFDFRRFDSQNRLKLQIQQALEKLPTCDPASAPQRGANQSSQPKNQNIFEIFLVYILYFLWIWEAWRVLLFAAEQTIEQTLSEFDKAVERLTFMVAKEPVTRRATCRM